MEVFIVRNGEREGPLKLYQLQEMLDEGEVDGSTIGWMRGYSSWVPLRELPPVLGMIQAMERERLDAKLAQQEKPAVPPETEVPYHRLPSHAVARYGARMIDVLLVQIALALLIALPEAPEGFPDPGNLEQAREYFRRAASGEMTAEEMQYVQFLAALQFGALLGAWVLEGILLARFGATPGKALFRLRVEDHEHAKPGFLRALGRSVLVFWLGMGARIPIVEWIANFLAFLRLQNRGTTLWDQQMKTVVRQEPISRGRILFILILFVSIAMLVLLAQGS